jgi:hypothetical protein
MAVHFLLHLSAILPLMELAEAIKKALHIFEEVRLRPSLSYKYVSPIWPHEMRWEAP